MLSMEEIVDIMEQSKKNNCELFLVVVVLKEEKEFK